MGVRMRFERFAMGGFSIVSMGEGVRFSFAGPLGDWSLPKTDRPESDPCHGRDAGWVWGFLGFLRL
jgi:hypothetical protein